MKEQPPEHSDNNLPDFIRDALHEVFPGNNNNNNSFHIVQVPRSAQQKVWILRVHSEHNNMIVIRMWTGSCNWWNCNTPTTQQQQQRLAQSEITAYRTAREHLSALHIPRVLHFVAHHDPPWAILEYVHSPDDKHHNHNSWVNSMIPVRHEFGFDEPHPRWGRLPVQLCPAYGQLLLEQVIVPLHRQVMRDPPTGLFIPDDNDTATTRRRGYRYRDMIRLYRQFLQTDNFVQKTTTTTTYSPFLQHAILLLQQAVDHLEMEAHEHGLFDDEEEEEEEKSSSHPCVLCHMDLQPQNLVFGRCGELVSVLDWEEAAYADCRFELLLVGRKVMANREQALALWKSYEVMMGVSLGPLEPWLKLETTHSVTALLLQAVAGGGRNAWEQLDDVQNKIAREFERLVELGWEFCSSIRKI